MSVREDDQRTLELEDMSSEFFLGQKPLYSYRFNGQKKHTGCAQCAIALDDSAQYGYHEQERTDVGKGVDGA